MFNVTVGKQVSPPDLKFGVVGASPARDNICMLYSNNITEDH